MIEILINNQQNPTLIHLIYCHHNNMYQPTTSPPILRIYIHNLLTRGQNTPTNPIFPNLPPSLFQAIMVRIKHRYLLVNILYPSEPTTNTTINNPNSKILPDIIQFHHPTTDSLTPQLLIKTLREKVVELFGDYGGGVAGGMSGMFSSLFIFFIQMNSCFFKFWFFPRSVSPPPPWNFFIRGNEHMRWDKLGRKFSGLPLSCYWCGHGIWFHLSVFAKERKRERERKKSRCRHFAYIHIYTRRTCSSIQISTLLYSTLPYHTTP